MFLIVRFVIICLNMVSMPTMQYAMFGSILAIGAMLGAITSGRIADFLGRKGVRYIHY